MRSLEIDIQRLDYFVITGCIKAIKGGRTVLDDRLADLRYTLFCSARAANLNQHDLLIVGALVLRGNQAAKAGIADVCRRWWRSAQIAYQNAGKKLLLTGCYVEHQVLNLSGLRMNFAGDFHA